jgi:hypothetical protein
MVAIMNDDFDDLDMIEYVELKREEREDRKKEMEGVMSQQEKKKPRKIHLQKDPRMPNWWTDYVLGERGTFSDFDHPNSRFCLSFFILF